MKFKFGELFSGPGGLALGAELAEVYINKEKWYVEPVWANDNDVDACETYRRNIMKNNSGKVICKSVQQLDIEQLDEIDALAFGFPCNDFSVVGEQNGINGKYGPLYSYGIKVIEKKNPKWFFAENVSGLKSADGGKTFQKILNGLSSAGKGYNITAHLYKFEEYGVPQTRHRIIIVGIRKDLNLKFNVPAPLITDSTKFISAKEALEIPPISSSISNQEFTKQTARVIERLKYIPPGENAWYEGIPEDLRLNVKGTKLSQIYRRLDPNKPSYTLTGSGGGGTHVYHWKENRALTNRERARLQTFPDNFVFYGGKESVRKQIGMAVPPIGAKQIIQAIFYTFAGQEYKTVPAKFDLPLLR